MFSKKDPVSPAPSITAIPAAQPKRAARGTVPSIISADLTVTGTLVSSGDIQIDGIVEGDVRSVGLVIGEKAEIHGEILAEDLTVRGRVMGRIRARKVQLSATSHVVSKATFCMKPLQWKPAPSLKAIAAIPTIRWAMKICA